MISYAIPFGYDSISAGQAENPTPTRACQSLDARATGKNAGERGFQSSAATIVPDETDFTDFDAKLLDGSASADAKTSYQVIFFVHGVFLQQFLKYNHVIAYRRKHE